MKSGEKIKTVDELMEIHDVQRINDLMDKLGVEDRYDKYNYGVMEFIELDEALNYAHLSFIGKDRRVIELDKDNSFEPYEEWKSVKITTAYTLENAKIDETLDIVTAECAFGMGIFKDIAAKVSDTFGGRSDTIQETLKDARKVCLDELRREAFSIGANAVIAVSLSYNEFSGQGKSMLFMVAYGTAVKISPLEGVTNGGGT